VLLDAGTHGIDRDLLELINASGAATFIVDDPRVDRDWMELGATAIVPHELARDDLVRSLAEHAKPVDRANPLPDTEDVPTPAPWRGALIAVTGPGGAGSSTVAAMAAQGFGDDVRQHGLVVLADLALSADQAVVHDVGELAPGLPELVDAHRLGRPDGDAIRGLIFHGGHERPYDVLLGLRRHRDWTALRPRAVAAALDGLRRAYRTVVCDVDSDVEGEDDTGSPDVEERNVLARLALGDADVVVVVGRGDVVGVHKLASTLRDLRRFGIPRERLLPVVNRSPRSPSARAEITAAVTRLALDDDHAVAPLHLGERRRLDDVIRGGGTWPAGPARDLAGAVRVVMGRCDPVGSSATDAPSRIAPGTLGSFFDMEGDAS
jgi:hypothetical protein